MFAIRGLLSFFAIVLRCVHRSFLSVPLCGWNRVLYLARRSCGRLFIIPSSLSERGNILGLLPFSGVMLIVLRWVSRSRGVSIISSPILMPVSFSIWSTADSFGPEPDISKSISSSVGMNGSFAVARYFGGFHGIFLCRKNAE